MSIDEIIRNMRAEEARWNDVREHRVFKRIQQQRSERPALAGRRFLLAMAGVGVAAAAALVLVGLALTSPPADRGAAAESRRVAPPPPASRQNAPRVAAPEPSILALAGSGHVALTPGSRVSILVQSPQRLELAQTRGEARYEITHREGVTVVVQAAGVEITVVGTIFVVAIEDRLVRVQVEQGVVGIHDGQRDVTLAAGEDIAVSRPRGKNAIDEGKRLAVDERRAAAAQEIETLFRAVDDARSAGDLNRAADLLARIIARRDSPSTTASAQFMLGTVERARGRHPQAATAFKACHGLLPGNPLNEDALAQEAMSWAAARQTTHAQEAAARYLRTYPEGIHALRMRRIVE